MNNQLVYVFEDPYVFTLVNAYTDYATKTTLYIVQHLYSNYACISAKYMSKNVKRLRYPYSAEETLKGIIERLDKCYDFAVAASEPVYKTQVIRIAYKLVADTGEYPEGCQAWRT